LSNPWPSPVIAEAALLPFRSWSTSVGAFTEFGTGIHSPDPAQVLAPAFDPAAEKLLTVLLDYRHSEAKLPI